MCNQPTEISDAQLRSSVRSLKKMKRKAYNRVLSWSRNKMKNLKSLRSQIVEPVYLFMTGGGSRTGGDLIKTIYHTVVKTYRHDAPMNPEKPTASLAASTRVATINIDGTTTKTALAIPENTGDVLHAIMSDQKRTKMRLPLCELKLISMVGNTTLLHIHQRLKEISDTNNSQLFAGISIIAVGDLY